ncbi:MAG: hypothetical protein WC813_01935 [Patescibacteria group bacterium]|jgi:hypothetical protein
MINQFFDKRSLYVLLGLLGAHILAALVQHSWVSIFPVAVAAIVTFALSMKRLEWGIALAFLEIFVGGHGHLFDLSSIGMPISIRIAIFLGVMGAFALRVVTKQSTLLWNPRRDVPWVVFGLAVVLGALVGFLQNDKGNAFDDFNSYLPILYVLPIISIHWDNAKKRLMLMTLAVSAVWVAGTTLGLLFAFTHLPGKVLTHVYTFVRDARLFEITLLTAPVKMAAFFPNGAWYFRVFGQSQIIVAAFALLFLSGVVSIPTTRREKLASAGVLAICFAGLLAGLSRTFVIAAVPAGALLLVYSLLLKKTIWERVNRKSVLFFGIVTSLALTWLMVVFPLPVRPDFTQSAFYKADAGQDRNLAVSSRWNLLPPMMTEIMKSPVVGSGFGQEVTFISDDPRVRAINGTGEWTTYRFEWGYQDLWLKTGLLGLVAILLIAASYAIATQTHLRKGHDDQWILIGLLSSIVFLLSVHVFTPYLNHPLGLSLLLLPLVFLAFEDPKLKTRAELSRPMVRAPQGLGAAVATSATAE